MKDEVNPAVNHALHAKAERAAVEAWLAAASTTPARRAKLMDRAALRVFKAAGTPADVAALFSMSIACTVLERLRNG
jgi:hypothetical protein